MKRDAILNVMLCYVMLTTTRQSFFNINGTNLPVYNQVSVRATSHSSKTANITLVKLHQYVMHALTSEVMLRYSSSSSSV